MQHPVYEMKKRNISEQKLGRNFKMYTTSDMQMLTLSENSVLKVAKSKLCNICVAIVPRKRNRRGPY